MKIRVRYTATFEAEFDVDDNETNENIHEAAGDVDIPEGGAENSEYVSDTFEIESITNVATGEEIPED